MGALDCWPISPGGAGAWVLWFCPHEALALGPGLYSMALLTNGGLSLSSRGPRGP